jgi:predicted HD phosphohydrolase
MAPKQIINFWANMKKRTLKWFDDCAEFCEKYDQNCFDPAYDSLPLQFFEPMVRCIFTQAPKFEE